MKEHFPRKIVTTEDGSQSLFIPVLNEQYHSMHGAIQESTHVFLKNGLSLMVHQPFVRIFEVGFGTGLNALLTLNYVNNFSCKVLYHSIEKYPLTADEYSLLNYPKLIADGQFQNAFLSMHTGLWNEELVIAPNFTLKKISGDLNEFKTEQFFDLVYFDAFAPTIQPDLWTEEIFVKMYNLLCTQGILVTYSAKGQVRRNLQQAGFKVERLPGPPGKREMIRATKL